MRKVLSLGSLALGLAVTGLMLLGSLEHAEARPQYKKAFDANYANVKESEKVKCNVCHYGDTKKNRNNYGIALAEAIGKKNQRDEQAILAALEKVEKQKSAVDKKTFGELLKAGRLPATGFTPKSDSSAD